MVSAKEVAAVAAVSWQAVEVDRASGVAAGSRGRGRFGEHGDVDSLGTVIVNVVDGKLDGLVLGERGKVVGADRGLVDEEVLAAIV